MDIIDMIIKDARLNPVFRHGVAVAAGKVPKERLPYPWCHQPEICINKGYCPRDPNCGE